MPVFFVRDEDVQESTIRISDPALLRHITKSLRFRHGDTLYFADTRRRRYRAKIITSGPDRLEADILHCQPGPPPSPSTVTLGQALIKNDKMAWVVQKATELGVDHICPLITERSLIKMTVRQAQQHRQRLARIALEAAQQAERWDVPDVREPLLIQRFFLESQIHPMKLLLVERQPGERFEKFLHERPAHVILGIGPEGGWSERELLQAKESGFRFVTLGERILRAETAAIAALCLVQDRLGNL